MLTPGFKFFFGIAIGLITAAVVHGYTTDGDHVGPLVWGWKGAIGDHVGYIVLMGIAVVAGSIALTLVSYRDADPTAQAHYLGVDAVAPTTLVSASPWPVVGAFGVGTMAIGLVVHTAVFVTGLAVCVVVAFEWTIAAWADRATGDPEVNKALRDRVMAPIEIPVAGLAVVGVMVLASSRILLNFSTNGAVVFAGLMAAAIFAIGAFSAAKPKLNKNLIAGIILVAGLAVLAGGIVAAVDGEREFHPHESHEDGE